MIAGRRPRAGAVRILRDADGPLRASRARRALRALRVAIAIALLPLPARAQFPMVRGWLPEFHLDVAPFTGAQAAAGASQAISFYARLGVLVAAGVRHDGPDVRGTGRIEVHGRFSADPIQELRWAPYAVGGALLSCADARRCRPLLLVRLGLEGPMRGGWIPGIELGIGDGAHLGFVLRAGRAGRR